MKHVSAAELRKQYPETALALETIYIAHELAKVSSRVRVLSSGGIPSIEIRIEQQSCVLSPSYNKNTTNFEWLGYVRRVNSGSEVMNRVLFQCEIKVKLAADVLLETAISAFSADSLILKIKRRIRECQ